MNNQNVDLSKVQDFPEDIGALGVQELLGNRNDTHKYRASFVPLLNTYRVPNLRRAEVIS